MSAPLVCALCRSHGALPNCNAVRGQALVWMLLSLGPSAHIQDVASSMKRLCLGKGRQRDRLGHQTTVRPDPSRAHRVHLSAECLPAGQARPFLQRTCGQSLSAGQGTPTLKETRLHLVQGASGLQVGRE